MSSFFYMYLCFHICISYVQSVTEKEKKIERYLFLGTVYEQHIKSGLNYLGKIVLPNQEVNFKRGNYSGKFSFEEGLLGMNLNIEQILDGFHDEKMNPLPDGALDGIELYYRFLVKKITIQFKFTVKWSKFGLVQGYAEIILINQTFDAKVSAIKDAAGRCIFVDEGLNTTLDPKKYNAKYIPINKEIKQDKLERDTLTILNSYVLKPYLKPIHRRINKKLIKLGESDPPFSGIDLQKEMENALCQFD